MASYGIHPTLTEQGHRSRVQTVAPIHADLDLRVGRARTAYSRPHERPHCFYIQGGGGLSGNDPSISQLSSTQTPARGKASLGAHDTDHIAHGLAQVNVVDLILEEGFATHLHSLTL